MSMTREEAIKTIEFAKAYISKDGLIKQALDLALSALRPVSQEQVEMVWRGEWIGVPNMGVYDTACSKCGYCPGIRFLYSDFCPNCGAPMTDEAVEMVMERLEKLHENNG